MNATALVQRIWNYCHTLRDDGVGYGDYLEQLTYLLFLKMAHEYSLPPYSRKTNVVTSYAWPTLVNKTGEKLEDHYAKALKALAKTEGMLGAMFHKAENKIPDPAKLARIIKMIDEENWISLESDAKGDMYEGLLQKKRGRYQKWCRPIFHPTPVNRCYCRLRTTRTDENHC